MTDEARIKARYPRRTLADYLVGGTALVVLLGTIVLVAISGVIRSNPPVAAMVRSFEVVSPTEIVAEIVVQRSTPADAAECLVFAQALSYEKVAEAVVDIPPGTEKLTAVDISLSTIKEAGSISVEGCRIVSK